MTSGEIAKFQEVLMRMVENGKTVAGNMSAMASAINNLADEVKALRGECKRDGERGEFAQILARLKQRGVITREDVARLERDGVASGGAENAEGGHGG